MYFLVTLAQVLGDPSTHFSGINGISQAPLPNSKNKVNHKYPSREFSADPWPSI